MSDTQVEKEDEEREQEKEEEGEENEEEGEKKEEGGEKKKVERGQLKPVGIDADLLTCRMMRSSSSMTNFRRTTEKDGTGTGRLQD